MTAAVARVRSLVIVIAAVLLVVIVPFLVAGPQLEAWSASQVEAARDRPRLAAGLVVLLLVADLVLPIPSSLVSIASGGILGFAWGAVASTVGMSLACMTGYGLGRSALQRTGRLIGDVDRDTLARTFADHGDWIVIASRPIPVLAESSTLLAGLGRMSFPRFAVLTSLANIGISGVYAFVGRQAVDTQSLLLAFAGAVLVPLGPLLWLRATDSGRRLARTIG